MTDPIIIVSMPRSGSSMTAGIFAKHGVWVGPARKGDRYNAKGYFESLPFKELLIKHAGRIAPAGKLAKPVQGWREIAENTIAKHGYTGGPWLVKHSAMYYPVWHEFPNAKYICVRRDADEVMRSGKQSGFFRADDAVQPHIEALDYCRDVLGGVDVDTAAVVAGDYSTLHKAFAYVGLEFDATIVDEFVDPSLWGGKK